MPGSGMVIGRGVLGITIAVSGSQTPKRLRYEIHRDSIQFYDPVSSATASRLFQVLKTAAGGRSFTVTGTGTLSLAALPAAPDHTFRTVTLTYSPGSTPGSTPSYTLRVMQKTGRFAQRGTTALQNLDLTFTESEAGTPFSVSGRGVSSVLE
ncbi:MAG: hypothetical protein HC866_25770 [Leptolyngbyaceae cyanobacterium RU_5_1]|nr:hypothetical protein [Leptolyngbyaceae cyanobacterium RU_5_1]